ncbi:MAG: hypothetical protein GXP30_06795 [Verrucomicrobia bacterium]|nr:hypothetical protein [Verrucomicrobiota bacterium]
MKTNRVKSLLTSMSLFLGVTNAFAQGTFYVDKNNLLASDTNPGTEALPWLTIQKAAGSLTAGETVYVKEGVYTEPGAVNRGIQPQNSGTLNNPITYAAYPGDVVKIDQQNTDMGFYLRSKSYITIKGFEIFNAHIAGIIAADQSVPRNASIIIEDNYIYDVGAAVGNNVGGVRLDSCEGCIVRNNRIRDIRINDGAQQTNSAGIHSYRMSNSVIENNKIWNSYNGVFFKQADFEGKGDVTIRRNIIHNVVEGVRFTVQGFGFPGHQEVTVKENLFYQYSAGIWARVSESSTESSGLYISNNTFVDGAPYPLEPAVSFLINGYTDVQIWNNISTAGAVVELQHLTTAFNYTSEVSYMDYNLYDPSAVYRIDRYGRFLTPEIEYQVFDNIADWTAEAADSDMMILPPDANSLTDPPLFVNEADRNYRLQPNSPARGAGKNGEDIGAYSSDGIIIGPYGSTEIAEADFNGDGNVDWMDLTIWEGAYGLSNAADADGDGDSDGADFLMWQRQLDGNSVTASSVPEPASGVFMAMALLSLTLLRGRRMF